MDAAAGGGRQAVAVDAGVERVGQRNSEVLVTFARRGVDDHQRDEGQGFAGVESHDAGRLAGKIRQAGVARAVGRVQGPVDRTRRIEVAAAIDEEAGRDGLAGVAFVNLGRGLDADHRSRGADAVEFVDRIQAEQVLAEVVARHRALDGDVVAAANRRDELDEAVEVAVGRRVRRHQVARQRHGRAAEVERDLEPRAVGMAHLEAVGFAGFELGDVLVCVFASNRCAGCFDPARHHAAGGEGSDGAVVDVVIAADAAVEHVVAARAPLAGDLEVVGAVGHRGKADAAVEAAAAVAAAGELGRAVGGDEVDDRIEQSPEILALGQDDELVADAGLEVDLEEVRVGVLVDLAYDGRADADELGGGRVAGVGIIVVVLENGGVGAAGLDDGADGVAQDDAEVLVPALHLAVAGDLDGDIRQELAGVEGDRAAGEGSAEIRGAGAVQTVSRPHLPFDARCAVAGIARDGEDEVGRRAGAAFVLRIVALRIGRFDAQERQHAVVVVDLARNAGWLAGIGITLDDRVAGVVQHDVEPFVGFDIGVADNRQRYHGDALAGSEIHRAAGGAAEVGRIGAVDRIHAGVGKRPIDRGCAAGIAVADEGQDAFGGPGVWLRIVRVVGLEADAGLGRQRGGDGEVVGVVESADRRHRVEGRDADVVGAGVEEGQVDRLVAVAGQHAAGVDGHARGVDDGQVGVAARRQAGEADRDLPQAGDGESEDIDRVDRSDRAAVIYRNSVREGSKFPGGGVQASGFSNGHDLPHFLS